MNLSLLYNIWLAKDYDRRFASVLQEVFRNEIRNYSAFSHVSEGYLQKSECLALYKIEAHTIGYVIFKVLLYVCFL